MLSLLSSAAKKCISLLHSSLSRVPLPALTHFVSLSHRLPLPCPVGYSAHAQLQQPSTNRGHSSTPQPPPRRLLPHNAAQFPPKKHSQTHLALSLSLTSLTPLPFKFKHTSHRLALFPELSFFYCPSLFCQSFLYTRYPPPHHQASYYQPTMLCKMATKKIKGFILKPDAGFS